MFNFEKTFMKNDSIEIFIRMTFYSETHCIYWFELFCTLLHRQLKKNHEKVSKNVHTTSPCLLQVSPAHKFCCTVTQIH